MFYRQQRRLSYCYFAFAGQGIIAVAWVRAPNISDVDSRSRREHLVWGVYLWLSLLPSHVHSEVVHQYGFLATIAFCFDWKIIATGLYLWVAVYLWLEPKVIFSYHPCLCNSQFICTSPLDLWWHVSNFVKEHVRPKHIFFSFWRVPKEKRQGSKYCKLQWSSFYAHDYLSFFLCIRKCFFLSASSNVQSWIEICNCAQ